MNDCHKHRCTPCIESTCAVVDNGNLVITVIPLQQYYDYEGYPLELCGSLPPRIGTEPVALYDGANTYPLMDVGGQPVVSGRLRGHRRYRVRFGAGGLLAGGVAIPPHFTVCDGLCPMEYSANAALQAP